MHYVYVHRRLTDDKIFYVGKGGGRAKRAWESSNRNKHWHHVVNKHGFSVEIIQDNMDEAEAFCLERQLIAKIGRANLVNMTDGGEGLSGKIFTAETKAKISASLTGKKKSVDAIEKHRSALLGRKQTPERVENRASQMRGRKLSDAHREIAVNAAKRFPCVCLETGEVFPSFHQAAAWLRSIGFPKASASGPSSSCKTGGASHGYHFKNEEPV